MAAEGGTPTESERQLNRAMDVLLASLIRGGKDGERPDTDAVISSLMLSDAITVVRTTARKPAEFKLQEQAGGCGKVPEAALSMLDSDRQILRCRRRSSEQFLLPPVATRRC